MMSDSQLFDRVATRLLEVERSEKHCPDILCDEERQVLTDIESKYSRLGTGTKRVVYEYTDSKVIKIARASKNGYNGIKSNKIETKRYRYSSEDIRMLLAPIYNTNDENKWLTMEKATKIRGYEHELQNRFLNRCESKEMQINDTLLWNVGYIPSRGYDCFIDYGN
jgi:hypothetical protein